MRRLIVLTSMFALLLAGSALAEVVTATDGDGNTYGDTQGFRIDFDATPAAIADWVPDLVSGQTYNLESLSVRSANTNATPVYLGVYTSLSPFGGFLGVSDNAVNFSTVDSGAWVDYTFTGIDVTVDSVVGSGSGNLFFIFQTGTAALTGIETTRAIHRNNGFGTDAVLGGWLANIIAWGGIQDARAPEYKAQLTPPAGMATVPYPANMAVVDLETLSSLSWQFNTDPNIVSISADVVFGTEPNMLLNTTYSNVTSPMNLVSKGIYLDYDTTYYWRVDSHLVWDSNEITGNWQDTKEGLVWTFTTLPQNKVPVITAGNDVLTAIEFLPANVTGMVNDWSEADIASIAWTVEALVPNAAKQMAVRMGEADLANLAQITADPNLLMDWIGTDTREAGGDPLFLYLKGLPAGTYSWKSYHHDAYNQHGLFDVTLMDANGSATIPGVEISDANDVVTTVNTSVVSNGADDIVLVFDMQPYNFNINLAFFAMNGLELTSTGGSLKIDFGVTGTAPMAGYQAYTAQHEVAETFTEQSYSAFGTTVSVLPVWGGLATVTDTTNDPSSATQSATLTTDWPTSYLVTLSATDSIGQTGSDVLTVTVAADTCAAAQKSTSWTGFNAYDFNSDCEVNLTDFAQFAGQWLDDRKLTGQTQF